MTREEAIKWFEEEKEAAQRQVVAFESCFKCFKSAHRKIVVYNEMAIAALREQPRWISVEERLPRRFERVLVWDEEEDAVGEAEYNGEDFKWVEDEIIAFATHWMPMPEPPEVPHG